MARLGKGGQKREKGKRVCVTGERHGVCVVRVGRNTRNVNDKEDDFMLKGYQCTERGRQGNLGRTTAV